MSTQQGTMCDDALDYLYEMLEGEKKAAFEAHLATCARCQAELVAFGRVRAVAKSVLPVVDPGERLTGALNAQLMHAATQQAKDNQRGKILPFVRRLVSHPGYAAAAGILFVGGVVGWQMAHGNLMMAPKQAETSTVSSGAAAPTVAPPMPDPTSPTGALAATAEPAKKSLAAPATDEPAGTVPAGMPKAVAPAPVTAVLKLEAAEKKDVGGLAKELDSDSLAGRIDESKRDTASYKADTKKSPKSSADGLFAGDGEASIDSPGAVAGGATANRGREAATGKGYGQAVTGEDYDKNAAAPRAAAHAGKAPAPTSSYGTKSSNAPSSATLNDELAQAAPAAPPSVAQPATPAPSKRRSDDSYRVERKPAADYKEAEERPANAAPPPAQEQGDRAQAMTKSEVPAQTQQRAASDDASNAIDTDRNRANALAQAGRCDEATVVFQSIERKAPSRLTSQDRLTYTRCLRAMGKLDPAQDELNQLRVQKNALPAVTLDAEQQAIDLGRQRNNASTKRAAKAKRATGASESIDSAPAKPADSNNANRR